MNNACGGGGGHQGSIYSEIGSALDFNFERLRVRAPLRVEVESENLNVTIRAIN